MKTPHSFHIPVMGTGFTIDTPLKVARYGISSVISLVDDELIEKMRGHYCRHYGEVFAPIPRGEADARARRITAYLDLIDRQVKRQLEALRTSPFLEGSEITKYFELLEDASPLKAEYERVLRMPAGSEKANGERRLRDSVAAGSIDVNIMTKLDRPLYKGAEEQPREFSEARAALRGFALSGLSSSVVFSAGLNLHLYSSAESFEDFYPDAHGTIKKRVILKVSDFRSAWTQAKVLAKRGIWISEYRIESGLNCGGHAFATEGFLAGPILEEFKVRRKELIEHSFELYQSALAAKKGLHLSAPPPTRVTYQGGIGTSSEDNFLKRYYQLDSTGWGTPFLLVPEATGVDEETLRKLAEAAEEDIYLSDVSPLGVPYQNLRNSASEAEKERRIRLGRPGSPCFNKSLALNTEFPGPPLCTASYEYQTKKLAQLKEKNLSPEAYRQEEGKVTEKSCICHDLGEGILLKYGIGGRQKKWLPAVCPGPNLAFFSKICSLTEMIDHIYGRRDVLDQSRQRPNLFINELRLYVDHLKGVVMKSIASATPKEMEYFSEFKANMLNGIEYYRKLAGQFLEESDQAKEKFLRDLSLLKEELEMLALSHPTAFAVVL